MKIGITYNLKTTTPADAQLPDDFQEEFDSPHTIEAIAAALRGLGHQVVLLGDGREFLEKVLREPPEFVFNFAEGSGICRSREARVPAVLDMLGIPYSGSDPLTCAVTLDKDCAKKIVAAAGVAVPKSTLLKPGDDCGPDCCRGLRFPLVIKPAWEGSSKGVRNKSLVKTPEEAADVIRSLWHDHKQPILLEEYIHGDEVTVGVYGNKPPRVLGAMRVLPHVPGETFIYSLEMKRNYREFLKFESPPALPPQTMAAVDRSALAAFQALGCRDVARVDFRVAPDGTPFFLEVNPIPGLNPDDSDLVFIARFLGWTYAQLIEAIVNASFQRLGWQ